MNGRTQLFKYWYGRGCRERGISDGAKFFYFYLCLNIVMAAESGRDVDREMITWVKQNPNSVKNAFERLLQSKNQMFVDVLKGLERLTQEQTLASNRQNKPSIQVHDHRNFDEVIDVIYRIRCNLFHGTTNPYEKRDLMLIKYSTEVLLKLVGNIDAGSLP